MGGDATQRESQSDRGLSADYRKGLIWTAGGTILASFEGLLVRLVSVDSWTVIVWRGVLLSMVMLAILIATGRKLQIGSLGICPQSRLDVCFWH